MTDANNPIDWQKLLKLANNKPEIAKELLTMFGAELPSLSAAINDAFAKADYLAMKNNVHKLHGSCCYTGVVKLKTLAQQLEELLRSRNQRVIETVLTELNQEIKQVLITIKEQSYENPR